MGYELTETALPEVTYKNKQLVNATKRILRLGDKIKQSWYEIAWIIADVDRSKVYREDGFLTVHDWVMQSFGLKKSMSYALLDIGKHYVKPVEHGAVTGHECILGPDFSKSQVMAMLPLGPDGSLEMVEDGKITPDMPVSEIKKIVKGEHQETEGEESDAQESEGQAGEDQEEIDYESEVYMTPLFMMVTEDKNVEFYDKNNVLIKSIPVYVWNGY